MKNKGFTLIELLSVIVVLVIIALIAVPIILGVVDKAKVGAIKSSVYGYVDAYEKDYALAMAKREDSVWKQLPLDEDNCYMAADINDLLKMKGKKIDAGRICVDQKNNIISIQEGELDGYSFIYENKEVEILGKIDPSIKKIYKYADLLKVKDDLSAVYELRKDITIPEGTEFSPIGDDEHPFTGKFNGNKHKIINYNITNNASDDIGFFGVIKGATIENLFFENMNIISASNSNVGGLAGKALMNNKITNIQVTGSINNLGTTGCLIGLISSSNDEKTIIDRTATSCQILGTNNVAGLIGNATYAEISNSYTTGSIKGNKNIGALVSTLTNSTVNNTYSIAKMYTNSNDYTDTLKYVPVIVSSTINNSYYSTYVSYQAIDENANNKKPLELETQETYENWDFNKVWQIGSKSTPYLRGQSQLNDTKNVNPYIYYFGYTGDYQEFTIEKTGIYKLETWGAKGGTTGAGGYSVGNVLLEQGTKMYVYVGSSGITADASSPYSGGWNGGGKGWKKTINKQTLVTAYGGGGATDIRFTIGDIKSRLMVAGGGGGDACGGGLSGCFYKGNYGGSTPGTQTSGNSTGIGSDGYTSCDSFGKCWGGKPGGGGWYGGIPHSRGSSFDDGAYMGAGGSGYVYTSTSVVPSGYNVNSKYMLSDTSLFDGSSSVPTRDNNGTMTGNLGDGFAKISLVNEP